MGYKIKDNFTLHRKIPITFADISHGLQDNVQEKNNMWVIISNIFLNALFSGAIIDPLTLIPHETNHSHIEQCSFSYHKTRSKSDDFRFLWESALIL